jgi:MazG family protein
MTQPANTQTDMMPIEAVDFLAALQGARGIDKLLQVTARLRHPTEGCPWDLKQTHQSLKRYMLEEAYEAIEAMDEASPSNNTNSEFGFATLKEELGDVLLQVTLHSRLAEEAGQFDFDAVCQTIAEKLIRRHPHVFGDTDVSDADAVSRQWEQIKKTEKQQNAVAKLDDAPAIDSVLKGVSKANPALTRALETSRRAVKVGFEWPDLEALWACVMSEYDEFRTEADAVIIQQAASQDDTVSEALFNRLEEEMGDILFASVNLARHFKIDPEIALTRATTKFTRRFQTMEALIIQQVRQTAGGELPPDFSLTEHMKTIDFETWDALWRQAKQQ